MAISNPYWPQWIRRVALIAAAIGVELSHYSSMYLFVGMLTAAWVLITVTRMLRPFFARHSSEIRQVLWPKARTVGFGSLLAVAAVVALWGGIATQTAGSVVNDVGQAVSELSSATGTPYSFLSSGTLSPQQLLSQYRQQTLRANSRASPLTYLPVKTVTKYATPLASVADMPLTSAGRALSQVGISVSALNTVVREGAADGEELFIAIGFAAVLFSKRLRRRVSSELLALCAGAMAVVAAFVIFPNLSSDFGVLRAFQEALILAAPILVVGSLVPFSRLGEKWAWRIATFICLTIFTSTIGLMPQVLGGYAAQLSLNNSGLDYDLFYLHPQEVSAADWLEGKPGVSPSDLQVALGGTTATPYIYSSLAGISDQQSTTDFYPVLIRRAAWVVIGYSVLRTDIAPLPVDGEILTYRYPFGLLQANKNLVYDNGGAEIYR